MTLPLFVGSLVSTWYGGLLGVTEIAFTDGVASWLTQGGFWYASYLLFAALLAARITRSRQLTLPDQVGLLHGEAARRLATWVNFVNVLPVAYVLALGLLIQLVSGLPLWLATGLGTAVAVSYSLAGGFRAVVYTDLLQFALMCIAVAVVMLAALLRLGGGGFLEPRLPATHLRATGALGPQELAVWALIALSTLIDPNFYHRCYAARSPRVAVGGIALAVGFWMLFDVCQVFGGLYARAALPHADPRKAYLMLAFDVLPAELRGLVAVGLLATVMSTIDSYCFVGAMSLSHDLFARTLRRRAASHTGLVRLTRIGIIAVAGVAMALALLFSGSFKTLWKTFGSLNTSALLVPMLFGLAGWTPPGAGVASMVTGAAVTGACATLRLLGARWAVSLEPLLAGIAASVAAYLIVALRRPRYEPR